jgi:fructose-bisphosphate aldolase class I
MDASSLDRTALELVAAGKGILAADESGGTIEKRLKTIGVESTTVTRQAYREMLFTTPRLGASISGVILFDETIRQKASDGRTFVQVLVEQGIHPGIKVDLGAKPLAGFPHETITEGLDGLRERLAEYVKLGARFTKWRAVIEIGRDFPTRGGLEANAHALARFAALSQEAGLVPIVEPEVLMDGNHPLERHYEVSRCAQLAVFRALAEAGVRLEGMLLKPNMILSGTDAAQQAGTPEIAAATLRCLRHTVPAAVPGIVFLSGGQADVPATRNLNALNQLSSGPWALTFSYGRALQDAALKRWGGKPANVKAAQRKLAHRAACNAQARRGKYTSALEKKAS